MGFWANFGMYIFIVLALTVGTIITIRIYLKAKGYADIDTSTKVINLVSEWSHGHSEGWLIEQEKTPSKLTRIAFYPTDLKRKERLLGNIEPEIIIAKNVMTIPIGKMSSTINVLWIFPNSVVDLYKKIPDLELKLPLELDLNTEDPNILSKMDELKQEFKSISTKQLFDHTALKNSLMFDMGEQIKSAFDSVIDANGELHFGAMSTAERTHMKEMFELVLQNAVNKQKEEIK